MARATSRHPGRRRPPAFLLLLALLAGAGVLVAAYLLPSLFSAVEPPPELKAHTFNILSEERLALTREYVQAHYGLDTHKLEKPQVIVIHHTAIPSLQGSLDVFKPATLPPNRKYIGRFGRLNVGVHYVVARDGTIWSLLPEDIIGRHTIGLNHLSLGIENVGANEKELTEAQMEANARLVAAMVRRHPSIAYLIGHHEYTVPTLPHYKLYKELVPNYKPTIKTDPGPAFMTRLRNRLRQVYAIELAD